MYSNRKSPFELRHWISLRFHLFVQALKSELEKASPSLGRSAVYLKESRINGLPRYNLLLLIIYEFFIFPLSSMEGRYHCVVSFMWIFLFNGWLMLIGSLFIFVGLFKFLQLMELWLFLKVLDHSVCAFFLEEGVKSEGQNFAGNASFLLFLYVLHYRGWICLFHIIAEIKKKKKKFIEMILLCRGRVWVYLVHAVSCLILFTFTALYLCERFICINVS